LTAEPAAAFLAGGLVYPIIRPIHLTRIMKRQDLKNIDKLIVFFIKGGISILAFIRDKSLKPLPPT